jgi:hypothetical protein
VLLQKGRGRPKQERSNVSPPPIKRMKVFSSSSGIRLQSKGAHRQNLLPREEDMNGVQSKKFNPDHTHIAVVQSLCFNEKNRFYK